ncbi:phenylalanine--tRNA ligase subunit alpha, partial [Candidatus Uhrbacteria bacterium CG_4_9_14_3_um_filter_36_7]
MRQQFEKIKKEFEENLHSLKDFFVLEDIRTKFLGRKGELSNLMKQLKDVAEEERRELGKIANEIKETMEYAFLKKQQELEISLKQERLKNEWIDITAPGKFPLEGHLHPVTQAMNEITDIFSRIGFIRVQVPEIDWDYYTFEALNMPKDHPARDNWETFFVDLPTGEKGKIVAVPHISNMQVRIMEAWGAPLRALYIGRAYRRQNDPSHLPIHHQFEILMVDEGVTLANLKGVIEYFVHEYFGADRQIRYRPHHFRFTEPSF